MTVACVVGACQCDSQIILHWMVIEWVNFKERYTFWIHGTKIFFRRKKRKNVTLWSNYQLNHLPQVTESLTQLSNLTPQRATNLICMWCRSRFRRKAGVCFAPSSLFSRDQQARVGSLFRIVHYCWMHREKTTYVHEGGFDRYLRTSI